ncbi:MAG: translation initiation factor IF-3 [Candidatus Falkowbacteria bacterium]
MKRTWRRPQKKDEGKLFRANLNIRALELSIIDENGENLGIMSTADALKLAEEAGLDLVEVNPKAEPPIAKILDYGQFKYEKEKLAHKKKQQQKKVELKGIRLTVRISTNDFGFKLKQAIDFLEKGNKLKIELILKGRERQHPEKAVETIKEFIIELEKLEQFKLVREQDLTRKGNGFIIILINKTS